MIIEKKKLRTVDRHKQKGGDRHKQKGGDRHDQSCIYACEYCPNEYTRDHDLTIHSIKMHPEHFDEAFKAKNQDKRNEPNRCQFCGKSKSRRRLLEHEARCPERPMMES